MMEERYQELKAAEKGAIISILAYIVLSVLKLVVGSWAQSEALRADGLNNFTDIIASVAILIGLRLARRPADDDHRYGHWKVETVASMVTSFIMLMVGLQVLVTAIQSIVHNDSTPPDPVAAYVGVFSAIVMIIVYIYNKRLSEKVKSGALLAAAKDNLSDAWTSIGTSVAIFAASFRMGWLDSAAAIVVALLIIKTALGIFQDSAFSLSDGFSEKQLQEYKIELLKIEDVKDIRSLRGRTYGSNVFLDVVVLMDGDLTVRQSHAVTETVEKVLRDKYQVFDTDVHVEPYGEECGHLE